MMCGWSMTMSCRCAQAGRHELHFQIGHPLGVPDFTYPGEVALGVVAGSLFRVVEVCAQALDGHCLRRLFVAGRPWSPTKTSDTLGTCGRTPVTMRITRRTSTGPKQDLKRGLAG